VLRAAGLLKDLSNIHCQRFLALSQQKLQNICCVFFPRNKSRFAEQTLVFCSYELQ